MLTFNLIFWPIWFLIGLGLIWVEVHKFGRITIGDFIFNLFCGPLFLCALIVCGIYFCFSKILKKEIFVKKENKNG